VIIAGGLVAIPTETVYGLAADALNASAVARIFVAKGRPPTNPVIVHVSDEAAATELVSRWPMEASRLADRFWPGPLTLVLPRSPRVPDVVTAGLPTVALRVPAHRVAAELIAAAERPLAAPSANPSTRLSPTAVEHVLSALAGRIDLVLDGGPTAGGIESTVLDLSSERPRILRPGPIARSALEDLIGPIEPVAARVAGDAPMPSPGLMSRHYAPRARLVCVEQDAGKRVAELVRRGLRVGWLSFAEPVDSGPGVIAIQMPRAAVAYAARLYATLHELDAQSVEWIVAELPPDSEEWHAIRDRLRRASTDE
jgi:L-threonylcarbamoyladenylate synthase